MTQDSSKIQITKCNEADPHELYHQYPGQLHPQDAFIALDIRDGRVWADWNGEIGSAVPMDVWHGLVKRWHIPPFTTDAANALMDEIEALLQRVLDGAEAEWDGNNTVGRYSEDAQDADDQIDRIIEDLRVYGDQDAVCWAPDGEWWDAGMSECITAETTDDAIPGIVDTHIAYTVSEAPNAVIDRDDVIAEYTAYRDRLREEAEDEEA